MRQRRAEEESIGNELSKGKGPVNSPAVVAMNNQVEKDNHIPDMIIVKI